MANIYLKHVIDTLRHISFFCNILSCYQVYQPLSKKQKCICNKALICLIAPILPVAKATNNKEKKNDERNITITQYF